MSLPSKINLHGLYIANRFLPSNDYRIVYPAYSRICSITYGLPDWYNNRPPEDYLSIKFGEGFHLKDIYQLIKLFYYLRENRKKYDFVHFYATILILFGPLIAKFAGVPAIFTITGFGRTFTSKERRLFILRPIYFFFLCISILLSKGILFQNRSALKTLSKLLPFAKRKFHYVGSAIEFDPVECKTFNSKIINVLCVARLFPDKGIEDFLLVADHLHNNNFKFTLIGPPSQGFENLLVKVQNYASCGIIDYLGEIDSTNTRKQYEKADIFFFPSYYGEGLSRVLLEAGFARLCPIAYDISANKDLIDEGRGFLVDIRDTEIVIAILKRLFIDRALLEQNACLYQDYIVSNYNISTYSKRMDNILIQLNLSKK